MVHITGFMQRTQDAKMFGHDIARYSRC